MNVYDFDKTIYFYDSAKRFYFFEINRHKKLIFHLFKTGFYGLLKILNIISLKKFKEKLFSFVKKVDLEKDVLDFWDKEIININNFYILNKKNDDVVCSATPYFLVEGAMKRINKNAKLVCSKIDSKTGLYEENEENCKGEEKVNRLKLEGFTEFNKGYGDSKSDYPMLKMCKEAYIVKNGKLNKISFKSVDK